MSITDKHNVAKNKICVVNPNYYQSSGVTHVIKRLYQGFQDFYPNDFDFCFVDCLYGSECSEATWIENGCYFSFKLMSNNPFVVTVELFRFIKWVRQNKFDVIHVHHRRLLALLNVILIFTSSRIVYTGHVMYANNVLFKLLAWNDSCAISTAVGDNLKSTTRSKRVTFVGNPVNFPAKPQTITIDDVKDCAVSIGRLVPIKGHCFIIEAFYLLKLRGINKKLIIVGEGPEEGRLNKLIATYGLEDSISLVGYTDDVAPFISNALFAILHSSTEGLALVIVEAAAMARATLMTGIEGTRETVPPDSVLPNLVSFGDVETLADYLEKWFQQPSIVVEEGEKFFRYLYEKHSTRNVVSRYRDEYVRVP